MAFSSWRGSVGIVWPTLRPGVIEEVIRILPEGIGVLPLYNDIRTGTHAEMLSVIDGYEQHVRRLAEVGVDLIHPSGAPPFMIHGYRGERDIIDRWQKEYELPIFTTGMNDCDALRALGVKRFVGISYFTDELNATFAAYFRDAGFDCAAIAIDRGRVSIKCKNLLRRKSTGSFDRRSPNIRMLRRSTSWARGARSASSKRSSKTSACPSCSRLPRSRGGYSDGWACGSRGRDWADSCARCRPEDRMVRFGTADDVCSVFGMNAADLHCLAETTRKRARACGEGAQVRRYVRWQ